MGTGAVAGRGRNESVPGLEEELGNRRTRGVGARGTPGLGRSPVRRQVECVGGSAPGL